MKTVMPKTQATSLTWPEGSYSLKSTPNSRAAQETAPTGKLSWVSRFAVTARLRRTSTKRWLYPTSGLSADLMVVAYSGASWLISNVEHLML